MTAKPANNPRPANGVIEEMTGKPPFCLLEKNRRSVMFVPAGKELMQHYARAHIGPSLLPSILEAGAKVIGALPESERAPSSKIIRALLCGAETAERPELPNGIKGLALLALETVANAIACWQHSVKGLPLFAHSGQAYYLTGSRTKRAAKLLGRQEWKVQVSTRLIIFGDRGIAIEAPRWFLDARELPFPIRPESVAACYKVASLELRDYIASVVGENLLKWCHGKPAGGEEIAKALSLSQGSEGLVGKNGEGTAGEVVEALHKQADKALRNITSLDPSRIPFGHWIQPAEV